MPNTVFMNMSADGFIAKHNDDVPFISDDEWALYLDIAGKADAIIVGRKTYDAMIDAGDFEELGNPKTIVVTNDNNLKSNNSNISFSSEKPATIISKLNTEGHKNIFICGGAEINTLFLKEQCVDKIKTCVSPYILGNGLSFLKNEASETPLKLEKISEIDNGSVLLEYNVEK